MADYIALGFGFLVALVGIRNKENGVEKKRKEERGKRKEARGPHYVRLRTFSWFRSSTLPLRGYRLSVRGRQFRVRLSATTDNPPPDVFARHRLLPMPSAAPYNTAPFIRSLAAKLTLQKKKDISVIGKRANRSILRKGKQRRLFLCCQAGNFSMSEDPVVLVTGANG